MVPQHRQCTELIIVCCHAHFRSDIYRRNPEGTSYLAEENWLLKSFQSSCMYKTETGDQYPKRSENTTFGEHVYQGLQELSNPEALLIFSGGRTNPSFPYSEAETYLDYMLAYLSCRDPGDLEDECLEGERWALEERATDSYQNLLFSIIRFHEITGNWPDKIKVVTHLFKKERFLYDHAAAIKWPIERIKVIGEDPEWACESFVAVIFTKPDIPGIEEKTMVERGERLEARLLFLSDPHGVLPPLSFKRVIRGWKDETLDEIITPDLPDSLQALLRWDRSDPFSDDEFLPWEYGGIHLESESSPGDEDSEEESPDGAVNSMDHN